MRGRIGLESNVERIEEAIRRSKTSRSREEMRPNRSGAAPMSSTYVKDGLFGMPGANASWGDVPAVRMDRGPP